MPAPFLFMVQIYSVGMRRSGWFEIPPWINRIVPLSFLLHTSENIPPVRSNQFFNLLFILKLLKLVETQTGSNRMMGKKIR